MSLHDRIKEARKAKGWTQKQLGDAIGVAKNTISGYEKNREPTAPLLGAIADALDVDVNFLLQDEFTGNNENEISQEEWVIIKKIRSLDARGKGAVLSTLERELLMSKQSADEADKQTRGTA